MSKIFTISSLALCAAAFCATPSEAQNSVQQIGSVKPSGMSPDGKYIVGYTEDYTAPYYDVLTHKGFVWTPADGLTWLTEYDGTATERSGVFLSVNNAGMRTGAVKDPSMRLPTDGGGDFAPGHKDKRRAEGEELGLPIFKAAVWRDEKLYELEGGREAIEAYTEETDGSYAAAISADGSMVVGYTQKSSYPAGVMRWKYNTSTDSYDFLDLDVPADAIGCTISGISADGSMIYGNVVKPGTYGAVYHPAVWTDSNGNSKCSIIEVPDIETYSFDFGLRAVSADGTKLLISGSGASTHYMAVYDIATGVLKPVTLPAGIFGIKAYAITDKGDICLALTDSSWTDTNYFYDSANDTFLTLADYLGECAADVQGAASLASQTVVAVSGDGRKVLFTDASGYTVSSSLLSLENPAVLAAPAPSVVNLYHNSPSEVTCTWEGLNNIPAGLTLKGYKVQIDSLEPVITEATGAGGSFSVKAPAEAGKTHCATVRTIYVKNGAEQTSGESDAVSAYVSKNVELTCYDNFDNAEPDPNGNPRYAADDWQVVNLVENPMVVQWCLDVRDYENNNPYFNLASVSETPWSCSLLSRFHDATDAKDFFLSFYVQSKEANEFGQDRTTDFLDVECSTDGATWEKVSSICAADALHAKWNFYQIPLGDKLAGKVFQLRLNAHGEGKAALTWSVDCIGISEEMKADAPQGLRMAAATDKQVTLTWQNTKKAWDANYVINSSVETDDCFANEGQPIMMAIDLTADKIAAHAGEYISAVSAFLYDNPAVTQNSSKIEAKVFCDGKEAGSGDFTAPFDRIYASTAWLDAPVLIEAGKTYRVAVNVVSCDPANTPVYCQKVPEFIAGVTDLYSEDGGATWQSLEKTVPGTSCIWSIHADITATPADASGLQKDPEIMGYNVYRNGEKLNTEVIYAPYMRFTDESAPAKATYTVQAFYHDGRVSPLSAPFEYDASSVKGIQAEPVIYSVQPGVILLEGDYDSARLYDMRGIAVASGHGASINTNGLPAGIYVLRITAADRFYIHKVPVR